MHRALSILGAAVLMLAVFAGPAAANQPPHQHPCHPHAPDNVIVGSLGNDRLVGTDCNDKIYGFTGNDRIIARLGNDTVLAGRGNDRVRTVDGEADRVGAGAGFDRCIVDQWDTTLRCEVVIRVRV